MFTYTAFVEELGPLIARAKALKASALLADDDNFRRWRHETTDLIGRIEAQKYTINCEVVYRSFDKHCSDTDFPSVHERQAAYNRDLEATIMELETLVGRFAKYGDPRVDVPISATLLLPPEKVTLAWLWQHAPVKLWLQGVSLLFVFFSLGVAVGQSALYSDITNKRLPPSTKPSVPSAATSKE